MGPRALRDLRLPGGASKRYNTAPDKQEATVGTCLDCDLNIDLDEGADIGDVLVCPGCKARLEIIDLKPVILDYAVDEDDIG